MHTILKYLKSNFFQEQSFYYPDLVEANGFLLQLSPYNALSKHDEMAQLISPFD